MKWGLRSRLPYSAASIETSGFVSIHSRVVSLQGRSKLATQRMPLEPKGRRPGKPKPLCTRPNELKVSTAVSSFGSTFDR